MLELQQWQIAPQQDPVVDVHGLRSGSLSAAARAKRMESAENDVASRARPPRRVHAVLHFPTAFIGERQPHDFLAGEFGLRIRADNGCAR